MVRCEKCDVEIPYLPFRCKYCGRYYCRDHRLPENHACTGHFNAPVVVVPTNVQKEMGMRIEEQPLKHSRKRLYQDVGTDGRDKKGMRYHSLRNRWFSSPGWRRFQETKFRRYIVTHIFLILFVIGFILTLTPAIQFVVLSPPFFFFQFYFHTLVTAVWVPAVGLGPFGSNIFILGLIVFMFYQFGRQLEMSNGSKFLIKFVLICGILTGAIFVLSILLFLLIPGYEIILYIPIGIGTTFGIVIGDLVFIAVLAAVRSDCRSDRKISCFQ